MVIAVALAVLAICGPLAAVAGASPRPTAAASLIKSGDLARDCVTEAMLDGDRSRRIRFVAWCSVQGGEARFSLRRRRDERPKAGAPILAFTARPETTGPGAGRAFRCERRVQSLRCAGRKSGPVVVRGSFAVPAGSRCAVRIHMRTAGGLYGGLPAGCPGAHRPHPDFDVDSIRSARALFHLDHDLAGDRAAIDRRIRRLIAAWHRGEPVARVSMQQLFQPLRAADQRRFEFREELLHRTAVALERWVPGHAADSYAGYELDDRAEVVIYVGFTGDQEARLAAFKRDNELFAPARIKPFPVPPLYSERALYDLSERVVQPFDSPLAKLVNSVSVLALPNRVEIGTEHTAKVKRLLAERFGSAAPFLVLFMPPGELLGVSSALRAPRLSAPRCHDPRTRCCRAAAGSCDAGSRGR